jgi:SAM-dependent MidA family methyltransferase
MSDMEMQPSPPVGFLNEVYSTRAPTATPTLHDLLRTKITAQGPIGFPDFMALALYQPDLGYYARQTRQVGREGDFFTSVSVGPLFGKILARRFLRGWNEIGNPTLWRIIECGANDATLATDILREITTQSPQAAASLEYVITEPLPHLRTIQQKNLEPFGQTTRILPSPDTLSENPLPGFAFGNEVLDALPCHLIEFQNGHWHERLVTLDPNDNLTWHTNPTPVSGTLAQATAPLSQSFPNGYLTEIRTNFAAFLSPIRQALQNGHMIWIDYGFAQPEYYDPARTRGTLRTFSNHRAAENPLETPGLIDLTAHVDFTALAQTAISLGCPPTTFQSQGNWLTREARPILLEMEETASPPDLSLLKQFQTLTHPAHLGARFHVLELACNHTTPTPASLPPTELHRLALRSCTPPIPQ